MALLNYFEGATEAARVLSGTACAEGVAKSMCRQSDGDGTGNSPGS